jgi:hypothetical protein
MSVASLIIEVVPVSKMAELLFLRVDHGKVEDDVSVIRKLK